MSFKNLKQIDIFRPKTPDEDYEDYEDYEDFKASVENSQKVTFLSSIFFQYKRTSCGFK